MDPMIALAAVAVGYLLGSISFARLVARRVDRTVDVTYIVTEVGDGVTFTSDAVSATSVRMKLGKRYGLLVALLDMAKVAIPVLVLRVLYPGEPYLYLAAAAAVAGHNWPIYHRFQGGRGESAIMGALLVIDPIGLVLMLTLGMVIGFLAGNILVLEWTGFILMVPWLWVTTGDPAAVACMVSVLAMWAIAMIPELRQYAAMIKLPNAPTNEQVVEEYGMSARLGRAMDNYSIPALVKRYRLTPSRRTLPREDEATAAWNAARAQVRVAKAAATGAAKGVTAAQADARRAESAVASLELARAELSVRAPFAGTVASLPISEGALVSPGQVLVRLADESAWEFVVTELDESGIAGVKVGAEAAVTLDGVPGTSIPGRVARIGAYGESRQGGIVYEVVVLPTGEVPDGVRWNMTTTVAIKVGG